MSSTECLFCSSSASRILCQTRNWWVRHDNYPAVVGHVELVPNRHVESFFDLWSGEMRELRVAMRLARHYLAQQGVRPDGWTIGVNDGAAAGRTIHHLHVHLIPRYVGDVEDPRGGVRWVLPATCTPDAWSLGEVR